MKKILFTAVILTLSLTLSACKYLPQYSQNSTATQTRQEEATNVTPGYIKYSPTAISDAAAQNKKAVLFFHAAWCPYCQAAEKDILKRTDEIPEDVVIIKTDYDTYQDLKKKYNVTYQHTFVQVDAQGNPVTIWNGGDLDEIIRNVK